MSILLIFPQLIGLETLYFHAVGSGLREYWFKAGDIFDWWFEGDLEGFFIVQFPSVSDVFCAEVVPEMFLPGLLGIFEIVGLLLMTIISLVDDIFELLFQFGEVLVHLLDQELVIRWFIGECPVGILLLSPELNGLSKGLLGWRDWQRSPVLGNKVGRRIIGRTTVETFLSGVGHFHIGLKYIFDGKGTS